jgi:hypothetical protein
MIRLVSRKIPAAAGRKDKMKVRRWLGASFLLFGLFCLTVTGHGQDIEWKVFKNPSKPFYQTVKTVTKQDMTVQGMKFSQTQDQTFLIKWTPKEPKDGNWVVEQEIVGVKMKLDIGGNIIDYDSTKESNAKNPMTQFFQALTSKGKFTLTIDPKEQKVVKVEGLKDLVTELTKVNKSFEPVLKQILNEDTVKTLAEPVFFVGPKDGKVPADKKWEKKGVKLSMGPLGTYTADYEYKAEKDEKDKLKIKVDTKLKYDSPSKEEIEKKGALPFTIKEGTLKTTDSKGTIVFDTDKGRIQSSDMSIKLTGDLKVAIGTTDTNVNLVQNQEVLVNTEDSVPQGWEKKEKEK